MQYQPNCWGFLNDASYKIIFSVHITRYGSSGTVTFAMQRPFLINFTHNYDDGILDAIFRTM